MKFLYERVHILELTEVGVLRRLVLENGELHEGLRNAVGDNTLWRWNWSQDNREEAIVQLVVNLETIE